MRAQTPEVGTELQRFWDDHAKASAYAAGMLRVHGIDSTRFIEADKTVGVIWTQIRKLLDG